MHRAGAALGEPAAEVRIVEAEIVAQRIEQRHVRIGIDRMGTAVHVEGNSGHGCISPWGGVSTEADRCAWRAVRRTIEAGRKGSPSVRAWEPLVGEWRTGRGE